jgi:hypothetical protein
MATNFAANAHRPFVLAALLTSMCAVSVSVGRAGADDVVAVYSGVSPDYHRTKGPGGAYQRETYAVGVGGYASGGLADPTIDRMSFGDVVATIAPALASQRYVPCDKNNPASAQILIMVYWGTTVRTDDTSRTGAYQLARTLMPPPIPQQTLAPDMPTDPPMVRDPTMSGRQQEAAQRAAAQNEADSRLQQALALSEMANRQRDHQDADTAMLLGYADELARVRQVARTPFKQRFQDVVDEVEEGRYYVVLLAYDFQLLLQHRQRKMLWQTRFSLRERGNAFDRQLASMALAAAQYFGQDSHGLHRRPLPEPNITFGPLRVVGEPAETPSANAPSSAKSAAGDRR